MLCNIQVLHNTLVYNRVLCNRVVLHNTHVCYVTYRQPDYLLIREILNPKLGEIS